MDLRQGTVPQLDPRRWKALVLLCIANFLVILDAQAVILALPSISRELGMSAASAQWVLSANLLTFGGLLLLGGRVADLLGRRRTFMIGTALYLVVSLLSGLAWNTEVLLAARALHGVAAALVAPTALSILTTTFPEGRERNKALAGWAGIAGIGATIGLLIGGTLTESLGWQWVFYINVPLTLLMLALSPVLLAESRADGMRRVYDVAGAVTSTAALVLLVYAVVEAPAVGWTSVRTVGLFLAAVVLTVIFVVIESRSAAPLVPLRIFRNNALVGGNLVTVAIGMVAFGMSVSISLYAQQVLGYSPLEFGLRQAIMPIMAFVGAYVAQALVTRRGFRPVTIVSVLFLAVGSLLLTRVSPDGQYVRDVAGALFVFGLGLGAGTVATSAAALSRVEPADAGLASGFNTAAFQIGGAVGVAIVSTVIAARTTGPDPAAMTDALRAGFLTCAVLALLGLVLAVALLRRSGGTSAAAPSPQREMIG
ncbi:drug resistance transporter, EmrB/QacA subfamily [Micromonospora nigra]|uniref:Drug resistance transporter, EmrB/QacA subfamily n=1 Tax=Micromonospora nigra TaxID=145857 RepID=A0A1C6SXY0_9ACTN|nr:MFS transporter [Micromonospora nigra]SCL34454.1 drug resistance transporter, EmrB/QacA subfamily [Micromonospora nigra]